MLKYDEKNDKIFLYKLSEVRRKGAHMRNRKVRKYLFASLICLTAYTCTGCKSVDLDHEQQGLVVEYAANAVLKHDKNNVDRMKEVNIESQTEEVTTMAADNTPTDTPVNESQVTKTMNEVVTIDGVDIQSNSYEIVESYPSNGSELGMSMVAISGYKLLVMKFNVSNVTDGDIAIDMLGVESSYKAVINNSVKMNVQVTALLDAMNTWTGTLSAHSTEEMVLVFQINENDANSINTVSLEAGYGGNSGTIVIK